VADHAREKFLAAMADGPIARQLKIKKERPCFSGAGPRSTLKIVPLNMPKFITTPEMFH
jgi:hypothetical protein